jgi:cystathionine beta-lyase
MAQRAGREAAGSSFEELSLDLLRQRRSEKWRRFPPDVLPAFVAEMDFQLAAPIREALVSAAELGDTGYASVSHEVGEALAEFAGSRFRWEVEPASVLLVPDVMSGVTHLLRVVASPGSGVVINPPVYPPFFSHIEEAGSRVVEAPLASDGDGYQLDLEALERAFREGARFYLLCNPHNPTGRVLARGQLLEISALAERYDVIVLADEIHAPLALPGTEHVPFLSLGEQAADRGIAFVSASKGWNIPGLKCAQLVVGSKRMRGLTQRLGEDLNARVGHLGVIASVAAYRESVDWLDELLGVIDSNRKLMAQLLRSQLPAIGYTPPQGTYLAWLDCRELKLPCEPADYFLERGRVALGPGPKFGSQGKGFVRVTMGTSAAILEQIVERMRDALG